MRVGPPTSRRASRTRARAGSVAFALRLTVLVTLLLTGLVVGSRPTSAQATFTEGPELLNDAMLLRGDGHHVRTNPAAVLWIDGVHFGLVWNRGADEDARDRAFGGFLAGSPGTGVGAGLHVGGSSIGPRVVTTSTALALGNRYAGIGWGVRHLSARGLPGVNGRAYHTLSIASRPSQHVGLALALTPVGNTRVAGQTLERRVRTALALRSKREHFGLEVQWNAGPRAPHTLGAIVHARPRDGFRIFARADATLESSSQLARVVGGLEVTSGPTVASIGVAGPDDALSLAGSLEFALLPGPQAMERRSALWRIDVNRIFAEKPDWSLRDDPLVFTDVLLQLEELAATRSLAGVYLDIGGVSAGFGQLYELRAALQNVRDSGLAVVAYVESASVRDLYLASVADALVVSPNVAVTRTGFGTTRYYFARVLERLGVDAQFVRIGDFKSGPERFTNEGPTPEADEQLDALYDDVWGTVRAALSEAAHADGVPLEPDAFDAWWAEPPLSAEALVDHGLADAVLHRDAVRDWLADRLGRHLDVTNTPSAMPERDPAWYPVNPVAVLHVSGAITGGNGGDGLFGQQAGAASFADACRQIAADRRVRGVVVRIDSPGGSAAASEDMWNALRQLAEAKPTVVSFGDIAASGGYYVASVGAPIYATPNTLTGSIGIYAGTFALNELFERVGVDRARDGRGGPWNLFDGDAWDQEERAIVMRYIERAYEMFLDHVAESRGITRDEADALARGRIYSGSGALDANLVDDTGGFLAALARVRRDAGIRGDITLVHYPEARPSLSALVGLPSVPSIDATEALDAWLDVLGVDSLLPSLGAVLAAGPGAAMAHFEWVDW